MKKIFSRALNIVKHLQLMRKSVIMGQDENILLAVDHSWSNDYSIGVQGWILSKKGILDKVEICVGDSCVAITSWHPRPDVTAMYPQYKGKDDNCGFIVHIPRIAQHQVTFKAKIQGIISTQTIEFKGSKPVPPGKNIQDGGDIFADFINLVNDKNLRILEIGSRVVSPGSSSKRALFPGAASYTGFDYYPDNNTDVVGDAHKLSQYFTDNQRFDGIFSISVFEHLAMPWVVAMEINKLLEIGGYTFHATHFAWPLHEIPWDFWRFSDEGLKVLFSPPLGFEVVKAGLFAPLRMHIDTVGPGQEELPNHPGFGGVAILAKKVAELDTAKFKWDVLTESVVGQDSHYPKPS